MVSSWFCRSENRGSHMDPEVAVFLWIMQLSHDPSPAQQKKLSSDADFFFFFTKASRWIKWSTVPLFLWNLVRRLVIRPFNFWYHVSLLLIIYSIVFAEAACRCDGSIFLQIRSIFTGFLDENDCHLSSHFWDIVTCPYWRHNVLDRFIWQLFQKLWI